MIVLAQEQQGSPFGGLIVLVPLLLAFYFLAIRPNRRRMQQMQVVQAGLAPGRRVVTTAGLHGTVTAVEGDGTFLLEIAPGVEVRFARGAVMTLVDEPQPEAAAAGDDE